MMVARLVLLTFGFQALVPPAYATAPKSPMDPLELAAEMANAVPTLGGLLTLSPFGHEDDAAFARKVMTAADLAAPPSHLGFRDGKVTSDRHGITLERVKGKTGHYRLNGQPWEARIDRSLEENIRSMQAALAPKASALELLIPSAHAAVPVIIPILAILAYVGIWGAHAGDCIGRAGEMSMLRGLGCTLIAPVWPLKYLYKAGRWTLRQVSESIVAVDPAVSRMASLSCPSVQAGQALSGTGSVTQLGTTNDRLQFEFRNGHLFRIHVVSQGRTAGTSDVHVDRYGRVVRTSEFRDSTAAPNADLNRELGTLLPHIASTIEQVCTRPALRAQFERPARRSGGNLQYDDASGAGQ